MARNGNELMHGESGWLIHNEVAALEQAYEAGDILGVPAHCLIGTEIDFYISMDRPTAEQKAALEATRGEIMTHLGSLVPKDAEQAARKEDWLKQIPDLTAEELINYHIYRRLSMPTLDPPSPDMYLSADETPEKTLEFVFGNGLYQTGYYDNPGSFEMRTQAAKPTIALRRIQRAVAVADEVACAYGAKFSYTNDQTNFSVWVATEEGLRPVHSLKTTEGQEIARKATAGMLHAIKDGMPVLHPATAISRSDQPFKNTAGPERGVAMRVVPDRFELRRALDKENHALGALMLMSGFAHGVIASDFDTSFVTKEAQNLLVAAPGFDKVRDLHLLRGLQESTIVDGRFVSKEMSELAIQRIGSMLSAIIGAPVFERNHGNLVIRELLGCISISATGELQADEAAFEKAIQSNANYVSLRGVPGETITERLKRVQFIRGMAIKGDLKSSWSSGVTFHKELRAFERAQSFRFISQHTVGVICERLAAKFTHEEGVALYFQQNFGDRSSEASEKMAQVMELARQFPDADHDEVVRHIKLQTQKSIGWATGSLNAHRNRTHDNDYMRTYWEERRKQGVEFLNALEKYRPTT